MSSNRRVILKPRGRNGKDGENGKDGITDVGGTALQATVDGIVSPTANHDIYWDSVSGTSGADGSNWGNAVSTWQQAAELIVPGARNVVRYNNNILFDYMFELSALVSALVFTSTNASAIATFANATNNSYSPGGIQFRGIGPLYLDGMKPHLASSRGYGAFWWRNAAIIGNCPALIVTKESGATSSLFYADFSSNGRIEFSNHDFGVAGANIISGLSTSQDPNSLSWLSSNITSI
ncbi:MAG: hypothetical protein COA43_11235 [Robiginitomaculum sp.]|nr:MAG: hypothetical protein COA43_11235 [Robiginitomaculum sp.]